MLIPWPHLPLAYQQVTHVHGGDSFTSSFIVAMGEAGVPPGVDAIFTIILMQHIL